MIKHYGATPEEWDLFISMGLGPDLLPVASNPHSAISPRSKMKQLGKTPSLYTPEGAVGISRWTTKESHPVEIAKWREETDYGICLQTRNVRAIDIDVDDRDKAAAIKDFIETFLNLPERYRDNSGKCLLGVRIEGHFNKRAMPVDGGIIEFLANGQQFIAAGVHPSGARYKWNYHGNDDFPTISIEEFELLWAALVKEFGIGDVMTSRSSGARLSGGKLDVSDDVVERLINKGLVIDYGKDGTIQLDCPFAGEHTSEKKDNSETVYFPAGTHGYQQGHFKCLHAHCAGRTDDEFIFALGVGAGEDFEFLAPVVDEHGQLVVEPPRLLFEVTKGGQKESNLHNVTLALETSTYLGTVIQLDRFRDEIMLRPVNDFEAWRSMIDEDQVILRRALERKGFKSVGRELMRDAVNVVAKENEFDSAIVWIKKLKWDGVSRIDTFCSAYFGTEDTKYTRAVARYLWTALAGRVLVPGIKVDMVPVLQGGEGLQKSSAIAAICPSPDFFAEISFMEKDDDLARKMRGLLVAEIAEMKGLHTRDKESILAFITRRFEKWTPKFKEYQTALARRCVFIGTTNTREFLPDEGEHRRWLPMEVVMCDPVAIERDRLQLWAEAREMFGLEGVMWAEAQALAKLEHKHFESSDLWEEDVRGWMEEEDVVGDKYGDREHLSSHDIFNLALRLDSRHVKKAEEMRLGKVMRKIGYVRKVMKVGDRSIRMWGKITPPNA